ncbi:hypothetical protein ElyMa_007043400 [Elysia marginata]|uniref:Uncharacterized protein n=1 Tax=Elysia marginata TaxID=1093978 RepID=A0AAV4JUY4_9GAST|nr:hypothetical protein ElyMa_007043400 [Elysia marginata]
MRPQTPVTAPANHTAVPAVKTMWEILHFDCQGKNFYSLVRLNFPSKTSVQHNIKMSATWTLTCPATENGRFVRRSWLVPLTGILTSRMKVVKGQPSTIPPIDSKPKQNYCYTYLEL